MKKPKNILNYAVLLFLIVTTFGCGSTVKNWGKNAISGVDIGADTLTMQLVKGLRTELADPKTRKVVERFIDSIVNNVADVAQPKLKGVMNDVFNHKVILWSDSLVNALTGKQLQANVKALQYNLVGKSTDDVLKIKAAVKDLLDQVLSDQTNQKLGNLRDQLLGAKTDTAISRIVEHTSEKIVAQLKVANTNVTTDISALGRWGGYLLLLLGGIAVIVIFIIWWNKRRYLQMTTLLAKHIHNIPNQKVYDTVTAKIKDEAISSGLEPHLRKILTANGLIGSSNWNKKEMD